MKLYWKIFLAFVGVLLITETLIFCLFVVTAGRIFRERWHHYSNAKLMVAGRMTQSAIDRNPSVDLQNNPQLKEAMEFLASTYHARIWISGPKEEPLCKTFDGPPPKTSGFERLPTSTPARGLAILHELGRDSTLHGWVRLRPFRGMPIMLHAILGEKVHKSFLVELALGLAVIGGIIALLMIPISRLITRPINRLRASAQQIAGGDLDHRVHLSSRDEIGQLGRAFDNMAARLAEMVRGGKELTANLSHELRTPLARIRVAEELLRRRLELGELEKCQAYLDGIQEDIDELDRVIGQIMDLSKLDLRKDQEKKAVLPLGPVIEELVERYRQPLAARGVALITHVLDKSLVLAQADALYTAFTNLLDNAAKYTPDRGAVKVAMSLGGQDVSVTITNTCQPISPKDMERIFDPFFRAAPEQTEGSGLGLAITNKIITKQGGDIKASARPGEFCMVVRLPLANKEPGRAEAGRAK